ncbi:GNAT family N-acetyltransferase [Metallibacterium sp.]|uniref:GNAT family N-acetyltransferase n=1 Tax=Metallibacterium sp. TaxID=2940281 RepID=UPI002609A43A|nr:GNAT family N-acetyltransferase [Metallibacterium sp.]
MAPQYVDDEDGARRCYPLMAQLRPHLATEDEFVDRWRRQVADGYRLLALLDGPRVIALAGFRVQENLVYGRFLYVDDLVTDGALRGGGHGEQLMTRLKKEARILGCDRLVLDTPLDNSLGHRFYFRNGLLAASLRFNIAIAQ